MIGSHLDSVRAAGRYDGPLGVLLGIECVAALHAQGRRLPFAIEVVGFGDEEGSRFPASMFCSRAVAGTLDAAALAVRDPDGVDVATALAVWGLDATRLHEAARAPGSVLAYLETHIEQGPVLEVAQLPVGIVTGIAAQRRFRLRFDGRAGHAGTTTMALRRDALSAAAEALLMIEQIARSGGDDLVATVASWRSPPAPSTWCPAAWTARWTCAPAMTTAATLQWRRSNAPWSRWPPRAGLPSPWSRCRHWRPALARRHWSPA